MLEKYKGKLYCFSPPVMLATFLIEFALAFYTIWRYKLSTVRRLTVTILVALGTFQLAEYMICGGLGLNNIEWARVGYAAITLLPPLGIHLVLALAGKKNPALLTATYITCVIFLGFYLVAENSISAKACYTNYAVFSSYHELSRLFAIYYYGWMFVGTYLAWKWSYELPSRSKALRAMSIGYLTFILPTTTFNILDQSTINGIPSIMCGFAIIFALTLAINVLPNSCKPKNSIQNIFEKLQLRI